MFTWDDRSLIGIGIPGRIGRLQVGMNAYAEGDDGAQVNTDRKDFTMYGNIEPCLEVKNKWLRGLLFEYGAWFCNSISARWTTVVTACAFGITPGQRPTDAIRHRRQLRR